MKLNMKLTLTVAILTMIMTASFIFFAKLAIDESFLILQQEYFKSEVDRVNNAFIDYTKSTDVLNSDWAHWNESYQYVIDHNEAYILGNISEVFFINSGVHYIAYFDMQGNLIYSMGYNFDQNSTNDVDQAVIEIISKSPIGGSYSEDKGKILYVNKVGITDDTGKAPVNGYLTMSFYYDDEVISELATQLDSKITLENFRGPLPSEKFSIYKQENHYMGETNYIYHNSSDYFKLKVSMTNKIEKIGKATVKKVTLYIIVSMLVLSAFLIGSLKFIIVDKVVAISNQIREITNHTNLSARIQIVGNDEIGIMKNIINFMLEKIEVMHNKLYDYASFDVMTGSYTRRVGLDKLEILIENLKGQYQNLGICYIDINDLKKVNDTIGHINGDQLIVDTTRLIRKNIRNSDLLVRLGGDEFLVIYPYTTNEQIENVMQRIDNDIKSFNGTNQRPYQVSFSRGIKMYDGVMTCDEFVEYADQLMYENKKKYKSTKKVSVEPIP